MGGNLDYCYFYAKYEKKIENKQLSSVKKTWEIGFLRENGIL